MRDIGKRIQRYRLSRYGRTNNPVVRRLRWVWLVAVAWLAWVGLLSDHNFHRIWKMERERTEARQQLDEASMARQRMSAELKDPAARLERAEDLLRTEHGMARPGELIYRIRPVPADSLTR
jgi:cell division protein FtsB